MSQAMHQFTDILKFFKQKLNATNFHLWSNKMEFLPRGRGLWCFICDAHVASGSQDVGN